MPSLFKRRIRALVGGAAIAAAATSPIAALAYDNLYVFGDSTSDVGRRLSLEGLPKAPYYAGRHSNGLVAVEYLAQSLGVTLLGSGSGINDFAVGGALTGNGNLDTNINLATTGMLQQFTTYSNLTGGVADANALYFIWGGANDITACGKASCTQAQLQAAVANVDTLIRNLSAAGARNFFVVNQYGNNTGAQSFNTLLGTDIANLPGGTGTITLFDSAAVVTAMRAPGNAWGFTNTSGSTPCYTGALNGTGGTVCADPTKSVFWDANGHLTATANQVMGAAFVAAVPEPAQYAMLLAGLATVAGVASRRTKQ